MYDENLYIMHSHMTVYKTTSSVGSLNWDFHLLHVLSTQFPIIEDSDNQIRLE